MDDTVTDSTMKNVVDSTTITSLNELSEVYDRLCLVSVCMYVCMYVYFICKDVNVCIIDGIHRMRMYVFNTQLSMLLTKRIILYVCIGRGGGPAHQLLRLIFALTAQE